MNWVKIAEDVWSITYVLEIEGGKIYRTDLYQRDIVCSSSVFVPEVTACAV